ncbi:hypothetical protein F4678DRAFT_427455 [Xylaria arbuscula]|nr:hypothetical protein F4678DRAFT_427455 [Xylaria arbuscula]
MSGFTNNGVRDIINTNNNNSNGNQDFGGDTISNISNDPSSLANATKTIYAASIIMLVFLAIQVIASVTLLAIWLHKRIQRRRREQRQNMEKHSSTAGYLRPVGYWGLPSSSAQQLSPQMAQRQQQHGQTPWHEVPPHSTSPTRFAGQETPSQGVAPAPCLPARCNNDRARSDFALVLGERRELA